MSKYVAPYQYPDGPVIAMQGENEFSMDDLPGVSAVWPSRWSGGC